MIEVRQTDEFSSWINSFKDTTTKGRLLIRVDRLQLGLINNAEPVGEGVSELKIDFGPGYRMYFSVRGRELILLLIGGDKSTQKKDIRTAKQILKELDGGKYAKK